jgi:hypothetical protein
MSLAFFTRTRTGEVQSRIANDIGGIDSVVTTTATSIAQNATTVIATIVAMVADAEGRPDPPADHLRAPEAAGRSLGPGQ